MVELMIAELGRLPESLKKHPSVKKLTALLPEAEKRTLSGTNGSIARQEVQWLHDNMGALVDEIMRPDAG